MAILFIFGVWFRLRLPLLEALLVFVKYYQGIYFRSNYLDWFACYRTQFLTDLFKDPFLSSVCENRCHIRYTFDYAGEWWAMMKSPLNEDASSFAVIWRRDFVTYLHNLNCWTSCHHFVVYFQQAPFRFGFRLHEGDLGEQATASSIFIILKPILSSVLGWTHWLVSTVGLLRAGQDYGHRPLQWIRDCPVGTIWIWHSFLGNYLITPHWEVRHDNFSSQIRVSPWRMN